jgi:hypothetical protein
MREANPRGTKCAGQDKACTDNWTGNGRRGCTEPSAAYNRM